MARLVVQVKTQTFATSLEKSSAKSTVRIGRTHQGLSHGFTLIELLVVLAIGALLVGLVPTAYTKARESSEYRAFLRTLVADMRFGRQSAMTQGAPFSLSIDLTNRKVILPGGSSRVIPESLQVTTTVGAELLSQNGIAAISFLPDGGSTGGTVDVLRSGGGGTRLLVDWLSGRVTQEPLAR